MLKYVLIVKVFTELMGSSNGTNVPKYEVETNVYMYQSLEECIEARTQAKITFKNKNYILEGCTAKWNLE